MASKSDYDLCQCGKRKTKVSTACMACNNQARKPPHGSRSTYTNDHCRCKPCTEAERIYGLGRPSNKKYGPRKVNHGTPSGYSYFGCRCELCAKAVKDYAHARRPLTIGARRKHTLRKSYGITVEDIATMIALQGGKCPICETVLRPYGETGKSGYTHVDHNHDTGKVRGIVCNACNQGLGKFKDNAVTLARASAYIERDGNIISFQSGQGSV